MTHIEMRVLRMTLSKNESSENATQQNDSPENDTQQNDSPQSNNKQK